jgi:hypothetical protein
VVRYNPSKALKKRERPRLQPGDLIGLTETAQNRAGEVGIQPDGVGLVLSVSPFRVAWFAPTPGSRACDPTYAWNVDFVGWKLIKRGAAK